MGAGIVGIVVVLIVAVLFVGVCRTNSETEWINSLKHKGVEKAKKIYKDREEVEIVNGPKIYIRKDNENTYYLAAEVNRKKFSIGSGSSNHFVLDSNTIEEKHMVIYKNFDTDGLMYYELDNYSKTNPLYHYNKLEKKYEQVAYRERVELDPHELFYTAGMKMKVIIPAVCKTGDTENMEWTFEKEESGKEEKTEQKPDRKAEQELDGQVNTKYIKSIDDIIY